MRKRPIILFSLLIGVIAGILLQFAGSDSPQPLLNVAFTGPEPAPAFRAAGFYLTNSGRKSILLRHVWTQVSENGKWKRVSDGRIEFSPILGQGQPTNYSQILEPGESRKVIKEWPEEGPWRVEILYATEATGVSGLLFKTDIAFRTGEMSDIPKRTWTGSRQVFSAEIRE